MERDDDVDLNEAAAQHIRDLDAHLEKLKRQNEALDALAAGQDEEMARLKRLLAKAAERMRGDAPPE